MKKIVALVLTLVLALSLATVAFAGTTTYLAKEVLSTKHYADTTDYWTLTLEKVKAADAAKKTVDVYQVFYNFSADKKVPFPAAYVLASEDDYDVVFVNGKEITYLSNALLANYTGEATAIKAVALDDADEAVCGDYVAGQDAEGNDYSLYLYNGKVMYANNNIQWDNGLRLDKWMEDIMSCQAIALVDGKLVTLTAATKGDLTVNYNPNTGKFVNATMTGGQYAIVDHTYVAKYTNTAGTVNVESVYCKTCEAKFDFIVGSEKDAIKAFGADNYEKITGTNGLTYDVLDKNDLFIKTAELDGASTDTNKGVDSAKTFDAGVVLYAGMALMSVAGSAVVIGKKKEF